MTGVSCWDTLIGKHVKMKLMTRASAEKNGIQRTNPHEHFGGDDFDDPAITRRNFSRLARIALLFLFAWLVGAYLLLPLAWRFIAHHHPAIEDMPRITLTKHGIRGDPINVAMVGTYEEIVAAMLKSEWLPADPITLRNSLRIGAGTLLSWPYETAPVRDLFVWGENANIPEKMITANTILLTITISFFSVFVSFDPL